MTRSTFIAGLMLFICGSLGGHAAFAADATLLLTPRTGVFPIGEEFPVQVRIDTGGVAVGSADVTVAYDPNDLTFVSYSTEGSIFSSIIKDEDGSTYGRVSLQGIVSTNRGPYTGSDGLFVTLTFRPLRNAATQVWFAQGAASPLVASVGQIASNILAAPLQAATYTLVPKDVVPAAVALSSGTDGSDFAITPLPVPNDEWFATTSVKLSYTLPEGVTSMRTDVSTGPSDVPTTVYPVPVSTISVSGLVEGTNYFHLQFKYGDEWGTVIHHALKVDLTPPEYVVIKEAERQDPADPRVGFVIEAGDALSGIARYAMGIDGGPTEPWERPEDGVYRPEGLAPGEHTLTAWAYDRAGNGTSSDLVFLVKSLNAPTLTSAPDRVLTGDPIVVHGTTYPDADVTVFTSYNDGEASTKTVKSDSTGEFNATLADAARSGKYTVWFSVADARGAVSPASIKRSVEVTQPFIMLFGSIAVTYLSVIIPLIALILLLGLVLWLGYTWMRGYRTRVRRETGEAYHVVEHEFHDLRDELVRQLGTLEKANQSRELTREEMRIFNDLSRRLQQMESHIEAEIDDIEAVQPSGADAAPHGIVHQGSAVPRAAMSRAPQGDHVVHIQPRS
jgi:hypothetical protein